MLPCGKGSQEDGGRRIILYEKQLGVPSMEDERCQEEAVEVGQVALKRTSRSSKQKVESHI